ncbi:CHAD domain-containing protein [Amycolatopsis nigrescens]|uniref:CHAD domain-containing protein n=1 Tax=Amycolatopsis nigrescens TaxID=381445 RepID=UPI0003801A2C|nr:CHAD domain-containing protein [Amycolatopsis nigrescens]
MRTPGELGLSEEPASAKPKDPPVSHLRAKLDAQVRALLAYEPGTRSGADPEDLHQMRVAVRRMRSVLKLSGDLLGGTAEGVRADLKWLGAALGEVRDYDVLIGHLRETVATFEAVDQPAASRLVQLFVAERATAKRRLNRVLGSARYATLLQSAAQLARTPEHEPAVSDTGDPAAAPAPAGAGDLVTGLRKPYRKLRKAAAALPANPPDDDLHALRIHGKRLRYATELAGSAAKKKQSEQLKALIRATKELQTVLGDHQDAVVAADRMRGLLEGQDPAVAFIAGRIAERELTRRTHARAVWPDTLDAVHSAAAPFL